MLVSDIFVLTVRFMLIKLVFQMFPSPESSASFTSNILTIKILPAAFDLIILSTLLQTVAYTVSVHDNLDSL